MSEWITDCRPIEHDESYVYDSFGHVCHRIKIANGQPWKPIPNCEPYVKPRRFYARWDDKYGWWMIEREGKWFEWLMRLDKQNDEYREAAERIAAIYEEVMP